MRSLLEVSMGHLPNKPECKSSATARDIPNPLSAINLCYAGKRAVLCLSEKTLRAQRKIVSRTAAIGTNGAIRDVLCFPGADTVFILVSDSLSGEKSLPIMKGVLA